MSYATIRKIGWFVTLWILSVLALGIVAYLIRFAINP